MARPRYHLTVSFGDHGIRTTEPRTWPTIRRRIIEVLNEETSPERVEVRVERARDGGVVRTRG